MKHTLDDEKYNFIGKLSIALYSQGITITLDALKQILKDRGESYSDQSNQGLGRTVSAAYRAWEETDPVVHHAISYTFTGRDGYFPWEKYQ
ncbi:MAG: hypothetical protein WBA74_08225 [Cyclobacteriaceae bacterium]